MCGLRLRNPGGLLDAPDAHDNLGDWMAWLRASERPRRSVRYLRSEGSVLTAGQHARA